MRISSGSWLINLYYGWKIVITLFITLTFSSGLGFYNHAVTLQALVSEKHLSITLASSSVSVFFLASGVVGYWIASLIDKTDVRTVIVAGAILAAGALYSIRFVQTDFQLLLAYGLFGVGWAASGLLPATTLITRWFARKRALALSITSTGLSVGGIVVTPLSAILIEDRGIDFALGIFAIVYLLGIIPLSILFLKSSPSEIGLDIDGGLATESKAPEGTEIQFAIRGEYFWAMSIAFTFLMMAQVGALAHQYGLVGEHLSDREAAIALGVIPITSIIGRLFGGVILDRFSATRFALIMMVVQSVSLLGLSQVTSTWGLVLGLALFGVSVGNLLMLQPLLIAEKYGQIHYGKIFGLSNMLTTVGVASGPMLLGLIVGVSGDYSLPYLSASLAGVLGWVVFRWAARR